MKTIFLAAALLAAVAVSPSAFAQTPSPISVDPAADTKNPAAFVEIAVPSHGEQLLGAFYLASGAGSHPTAIIFHGFPGYEQNLDIAQTIIEFLARQQVLLGGR
jgi:hypothetical protein